MKPVHVDYDGQVLTLQGWLNGIAQFYIPRGGSIELCKVQGKLEVICRDRNGQIKPMRVEEVG